MFIFTLKLVTATYESKIMRTLSSSDKTTQADALCVKKIYS